MLLIITGSRPWAYLSLQPKIFLESYWAIGLIIKKSFKTTSYVKVNKFYLYRGGTYHMNLFLLFLYFVTNLLAGFFLLYPFYLRDKKPQYYKGIWLWVGTIFKNRGGAVYFLIILSGFSIGNIIELLTQIFDLPLKILVTGAWITFFGLVFLCYPFHLKHKSPEKYQGIWRAIGEWLGE